jgi:hypothetical protein
MGQSRSVTILQSYLIRHEAMSLLETCQLFEEEGILTKLNPGMSETGFILIFQDSKGN